MTVSSTARSETFACNGVTTVFVAPFRVLESTAIHAYRVTITTGVSEELVNGTDFTVSGVRDANTTVTTTTAYSALYRLHIKSVTPRVQETDYRDNDPFPAESHEVALDRLTYIALEDAETLSRALIWPDTEESPVMPPAASRANRLMGFDADGVLSFNAPVDGTAASLALALASHSTALQGAGMVGYDQSLSYAADTVGAALNRARTIVPSGGSDTGLIQEAADDAAGGTLRFAPGTYILDGAGITMPANTGVYLEPGAVIDMSTADAKACAFSWSGTEGAAYNLTVSATKGDRAITISSANLVASGIAAGDWVRVASDALFDPLRTSSKIGELIQVDSVNTGTGVITFEVPLADSYATGDTAQVSRVSLVEGAYLDGPGKIISDKVSSDLHKAVQVFLGYRPYIGKVFFEGLSNIAIWLRDCVRYLVVNPHFEDFLASSTAYGLSVDNACQDGLAIGMTARKCRHLFTTNNSTATRGIPRRCIFTDWVIEDTSYATGGSMGGGDAVDTHAAAEHIHIWNGIVRGASNQGVNIECPSGSLVNVWVYSSLDNGISIANQSGRTGDFVVENAHSYAAGGKGITINPVNAGYSRLSLQNIGATDSANEGVYIFGNASNPITWLAADGMYAVGARAATASVYVQNVSSGSISNTRVQDPTATGQHGMRIRDCTQLAINGVTGQIASAATGSLLYLNASAPGLCSSIVVDGIIGTSPAAVSSRGILIDDDATNVTIGHGNRLDAFTTKISWGSGTGHRGGAAYGSATYDPANLADGAGTTTTVTVAGAAVGDAASASFSLDVQGITVSAWVSAANTVSVRFQNETGGPLDLGSGTLRAATTKLGS